MLFHREYWGHERRLCTGFLVDALTTCLCLNSLRTRGGSLVRPMLLLDAVYVITVVRIWRETQARHYVPPVYFVYRISWSLWRVFCAMAVGISFILCLLITYWSTCRSFYVQTSNAFFRFTCSLLTLFSVFLNWLRQAVLVFASRAISLVSSCFFPSSQLSFLQGFLILCRNVCRGKSLDGYAGRFHVATLMRCDAMIRACF